MRTHIHKMHALALLVSVSLVAFGVGWAVFFTGVALVQLVFEGG